MKVLIDFREPEIFYDRLKELEKEGIEVKKSSLLLGDFVVGDIAIERKAREDFEESIVDGRLFRQLEELLVSFPKVVLIIEGTKRFERIAKSAIVAAISSYLVRNVSVFFTRNEEETAELIYWIAKKYKSHGKEKALIGRKPKETSKIAFNLFLSLPGISVKLAKNLAKKFGSFKNLANASLEELKSVEGIGEKKAKKIKEVLEFDLKGFLEE